MVLCTEIYYITITIRGGERAIKSASGFGVAHTFNPNMCNVLDTENHSPRTTAVIMRDV